MRASNLFGNLTPLNQATEDNRKNLDVFIFTRREDPAEMAHHKHIYYFSYIYKVFLCV